MAKNELNNIEEGLRRLQDYEQTLKRIESLAKSIAATLNGAGGDKAGAIASLQSLQALRIEAQTGAVVGGGSAGGQTIGGAGNPLEAAMGSGVSVFLLTSLENARQKQQPSNPLNPFSGAPAVGPSSSIGTPGSQFNAWYYQQQQARQTQRQIMIGTAGFVGLHFVNSGLNAYASNMASGDYDPMQGAASWGGLSGSIVGGILGGVGSPGAPGAGAATGALAGQSLGAAAFQALIAPRVQQRNAQIALQSIAARQGAPLDTLAGHYANGEVKTQWGRFGPRYWMENEKRVTGGLDTMQEEISFGGKTDAQILAIKGGIYTGRDIISLKQITDVYATLGSALLASGEDSSGALTFTRNLASRYFMGSPQMARLAAPVMAARSRFNNNGADLLLNFGPEAYGAYQDAVGGSDLTPRQLTAYGNIQRQETRAQIASLQTRGAAAASLAAVSAGMNEIASLPGGKDSLAFAQASAQARNLGFEAFQTDQITRFDLPMTALQGRMTRANLMPYGSGNTLSLQFENIGLQRRRIGDLESFRARRRASGELSEQEELLLSREIESSRNSIAGSIHNLGEGREYILPALTAGATRYSGRFTSTSLAAMAMYRGGSPVRGYGAVNGAHLAQQDALWAAMGGSGMEMPHSRWGGLASGRDSKEIVQAIDRLTATMERLMTGRGGSVRPGEAAAQSQGALSRRELGSGPLYDMAN